MTQQPQYTLYSALDRSFYICRKSNEEHGVVELLGEPEAGQTELHWIDFFVDDPFVDEIENDIQSGKLIAHKDMDALLDYLEPSEDKDLLTVALM